MKKKISPKQVLAIIAAALLAGLYIACLVLALIHNDWAVRMLQLTVVLTILIPIILYVLMMFYKLGHRKDDPTE